MLLPKLKSKTTLTSERRDLNEYSRTSALRRSWMVYTFGFLCNDMDVDVYMDIIPLEISRIDCMKVYIIQLILWAAIWK